MGPSSRPSFGQKMVRPVRVLPMAIGQLIEDGPRCAGSSDGWYWNVPSFGASSTGCGTNNSTYAIMHTSALNDFISSSASGVFQLFGWCSGRPFSLASTLSGSSARPALSGAQHTATTFSPRSSNFSRTALPKASCPCTTIRIAGFL